MFIMLSCFTPFTHALKTLKKRPARFLSSISKMASVQLADMRQPYVSGTLLEKDLPTLNPIELFEKWFLEVKEGGLMYESNAVALSTTTKTGFPSSRMVLLKGYGPDGFVFFSNYNSRKGKELEENPNGSLLFYWDRHHRQVRVEGTVERTSADVSDKYFHSRPRDSQLSAAVSRQSHVIESRAQLEEEYAALREKHSDVFREVPRPVEWGGFCLRPLRMEFWQGHSSRLHDRIVFRKVPQDEKPVPPTVAAAPGWHMERLAP
uniref:pyridoxal 5'-phosphate synthase n=4 Tax=Ixodes ricinus TaxID=34613 RepID=V5ICS0_IXORI